MITKEGIKKMEDEMNIDEIITKEGIKKIEDELDVKLTKDNYTKEEVKKLLLAYTKEKIKKLLLAARIYKKIMNL